MYVWMDGYRVPLSRYDWRYTWAGRGLNRVSRDDSPACMTDPALRKDITNGGLSSMFSTHLSRNWPYHFIGLLYFHRQTLSSERRYRVLCNHACFVCCFSFILAFNSAFQRIKPILGLRPNILNRILCTAFTFSLYFILFTYTSSLQKNVRLLV